MMAQRCSFDFPRAFQSSNLFEEIGESKEKRMQVRENGGKAIQR